MILRVYNLLHYLASFLMISRVLVTIYNYLRTHTLSERFREDF